MKNLKTLFLVASSGLCVFLSSCEKDPIASDLTISEPSLRPAGPLLPHLINIEDWLMEHRNVAASIKWQFQQGSHPVYLAYYVTESDKISWKDWSAAQKSDLVSAFYDAYYWYYANYTNGTDQVPLIQKSIEQIYPNGSTRVYITPSDAWNLYIRWVAHSLFIEAYHILPWSITNYSSVSLDLLFDSSSFMRRAAFDSEFILGFDLPAHDLQPERKNLIGHTTISAPIYTYKFLKNNNILPTWGVIPKDGKKVVIKNLINWSSSKMAHFNGQQNQQNSLDYWAEQAPAFLRVAEGSTHPTDGFAHWTAGCGGTTSFFAHALRAVNIPVQQLAVCSHYLPVFPTEGLFIDHGDNPYNSAYTSSGLGPKALLQDADLFQALFKENLFDIYNILNGEDPSTNPTCDNVGWTSLNLYQ